MQNLVPDALLNAKIWIRLLEGLGMTLKISFVSVGISVFTGIIFGLLMASNKKPIQLITKFYFEMMRIVPVLVWLFIFYFTLSIHTSLSLSSETCAYIVFVMWGTAEMGDIIRGAVTSMPKHQFESGIAIGLSNLQVYRYVIIPQALRRMLPASINLVTRMIKTTVLVVFVSLVEVVKVGQQIIEVNNTKEPTIAFWIYGIIFFMYFFICFPISRLSKYLEKRYMA